MDEWVYECGKWISAIEMVAWMVELARKLTPGLLGCSAAGGADGFDHSKYCDRSCR